MKKKHKQTLDLLYRHYAESLYYYLLKISGSPHLAEELVQETFYRATVSLDLYQMEEARAWLFKVARNTYIDEWRKRKRRKWLPFYEHLFTKESMLSPYGEPESDLLRKENRQLVKEGLEALPEAYRTILYLREFQQFSYSELQFILNMNDNQVKVNLHRARQKLKDILEKNGVDEDNGK